VVLRWDPDAIIASVFSDPKMRAIVKQGVFADPDWLELDRGTLDREDAIRRAARRTGVAEPEVRKLLYAVPASLVAFPETVDLLYRLKAKRHPLYCLSNMHRASLEHIQRAHGFWDVFSGTAFSCSLHLCKPEAGIYEHVLQAFRLKPEETLFMDDVQENLDGAARLGIRTLKFENAAQCERELRALGVTA
jgi:putative hydrolase of the HAD superfamily